MDKWTVVLALCWLSACVVAQWTDSSWTDTEYGGTMYLCFEDDEMNGSYSEYGVVQGTRDGNRIRGVWFEAGDGDCNHGEFDWNLLNSGDGFTGVWTCKGGTEEGVWSETRVGGPSTTDDVLCAKIELIPMVGVFTEGDFTGHFCFKDDDDYTVSYSYSGIEGYQAGPQYDGDAWIYTGVYYESGAGSGPTGQSLFFRMPNEQIGRFYWRFDDADEIDTRADISNPNMHGVQILTRQGETVSVECRANEYLVPDEPQQTFSQRSQGSVTISDLSGLTAGTRSFPSTASPKSTNGSTVLMASFALLLLVLAL